MALLETDIKERILGVELIIPRGQKVSPLNFSDIYEVAEKLIKLAPDELDAIQMQGPDPNRVDLTTASLDVWTRLDIYRLIEQKFILSSGKTVRLVKPCEAVSDIRVKRVPSWWREDEIKRIFSWYGTVRSIYQEKFRNNIDPNNVQNNQVKSDYRELKNGVWRVKMVVTKPIPSTLVISNFKLEIFYRGQIQTCWRCGQAVSGNHRRFDCEVNYRDFLNRFSIEEFPALMRVPSVNSIPNLSNASSMEDLTRVPDQSEDPPVVTVSSVPAVSVAASTAPTTPSVSASAPRLVSAAPAPKASATIVSSLSMAVSDASASSAAVSSTAVSAASVPPVAVSTALVPPVEVSNAPASSVAVSTALVSTVAVSTATFPPVVYTAPVTSLAVCTASVNSLAVCTAPVSSVAVCTAPVSSVAVYTAPISSVAPVSSVAVYTAPVLSVAVSAALSPSATVSAILASPVAVSTAPVHKVAISTAPASLVSFPDTSASSVTVSTALASSVAVSTELKRITVSTGSISLANPDGSAGESSDGAGTISEAYERVVAGPSQEATQLSLGAKRLIGAASKMSKCDSDSTWTASEDDLPTPAQGSKVNTDDWSMGWEEDIEDSWSKWPEPTRKRDIPDSAEDEKEVIKLNRGSFIISNPSREKKKKKSDT